MSKETTSLDDLLREKVDEALHENPVAEEVAEEKSPLEKLKEAKEKSGGGIIIDKADYEEEGEKVLLKSTPMDDQREKEFKEYMDDMDSLIDAAQSVTIQKVPQNPMETVALIDQLDAIAHQKEAPISEEEMEQRKKTLEKVREYSDIQDSEKVKIDTSIVSKKEKNSNVALADASNRSDDETLPSETTTEEAVEETEPEDPEKTAIVNIIIDKTGLGAEDIGLTEEEKDKVRRATEIRLTTVETLELESIEFDAPDKSFIEDMGANIDSFGTSTSYLVSSGYKATVKGIGYGLLGDLIVNDKMATFDKYMKSYSIIYKSIVNTTVGKFKSFEDFLKSTSFIDLNMLLFNIIVSTFPDVDKVSLTCRKCGKTFEHTYSVRSLCDIKAASKNYLEKLQNLIEVPTDRAESYHKKASVYKVKTIRLPHSNWLVDVGICNAYDYLYQIIGNTVADEFIKNHKDDYNQILQANVEFLSIVRGVAVPKPNGRYVKYENFEDVIQALYRLPIEDVSLLFNMIQKFYNDYNIGFSLQNTTCSHCGTSTERNQIDLYDLVFTKLQQLASTEIDTETLPSL